VNWWEQSIVQMTHGTLIFVFEIRMYRYKYVADSRMSQERLDTMGEHRSSRQRLVLFGNFTAKTLARARGKH